MTYHNGYGFGFTAQPPKVSLVKKPKPPPPPPRPRVVVTFISCPPESECQRCIGLVRYMAQTRVVLTTVSSSSTRDMCSRCLEEWFYYWPYVDFQPLHPAGTLPRRFIQDSEVVK